MSKPLILLDGPVGTELAARGIPTPLPDWSAHALEQHPEAVQAIHRDYAEAGARVHTANTFRTRRRNRPADWLELTQRAIALARAGAAPGQRVAGSLAPLEDCYRPDLSPADPGPEHAQMAKAMAEAGVDLILCETFPHVGEALSAVEAGVATGLETWVAFTAGPEADLMSPAEMAAGASAAVERGARAVLVNCVPVTRSLEFVRAFSELDVPFGAYANAGSADEAIGWQPTPFGAERYAEHARSWVEAGASLIGSCCGTGPAHIAALREHLGSGPL